jgi:NAD(P)-dependent dehydrogenase (short-subunit alcohol dehydrogenase family)
MPAPRILVQRGRLWRAELDVTDTTRMRGVVERAFADLGRIDVVVSNAGYGVIGLAEELSDEQIRRQLDTNVVAPIQLVRAVTPHLREQGGGRILQTSSMGGHIAYPAMSLYHTSKWAIEGFFEAYALDAVQAQREVAMTTDRDGFTAAVA